MSQVSTIAVGYGRGICKTHWLNTSMPEEIRGEVKFKA
jgi:hypothetical protein